jgi:hypothetical protein
MADLLESGLYYMHGRDKSLRPLMMFCPKVFVTLKMDLHDAMMATHFMGQYIVNYMMRPGKVENWLIILDLAHLGITSQPKNSIIQFVKNFNHNYYQRNIGMFLMNTSWGIRAMWGIIKPFVHPTTRQKLIFEGGHSSKILIFSSVIVFR